MASIAGSRVGGKNYVLRGVFIFFAGMIATGFVALWRIDLMFSAQPYAEVSSKQAFLRAPVAHQTDRNVEDDASSNATSSQ